MNHNLDNGLDYDSRSKEGYDEEFSLTMELPENEDAAKYVAEELLDAQYDKETVVTRWGDGFYLIENARLYYGQVNITVWLAGYGNNELNDVEIEDRSDAGYYACQK